MPTDEELAATSDRMLDMLNRLRATEDRKRQLEKGSPEFLAATREAERLARMVFRWTEFQMDLASQSPKAVADGDMSGQPISDIEARPLDRILAEWREADLRLGQAARGTPESEKAAQDIERLRAEFRAIQDTGRRD